nr:hypothetical protein GCM10025699_11570 [Microbacterium flavescens]
MSATPEPFDALVTHAHETRVLVVGAGIAGLVAALECAKVGMPVTVLEAAGRPGGTIAEAEVGGLRVDVGASCWSTADGDVDALVAELDLAPRAVSPSASATWIAGLGRSGAAAAPVPADSVLGIPANPWAQDVRPFIGLSGAWRAYLDRLRPPLTIGKERNLDRLVRTRMGDAVVDRMVAPLSVGRFGLAPSHVDVAAAAPGLSSALTRTGSLGERWPTCSSTVRPAPGSRAWKAGCRGSSTPSSTGSSHSAPNSSSTRACRVWSAAPTGAGA